MNAATPRDTLWRRESIFWACVALGFIALYGIQGNAQETQREGHSAIAWMVHRWNGGGGNLSHGYLIPLVSAWAIWRRRRELITAPKTAYPPALALIIMALLVHLAGYRTQLTRLSILSMVFLSWAIPLYVYGKGVARLLVFPCSYLLFCIPLSFLNTITVPLRLLASQVAAFLLNGIGIPAVSRGTAIFSAAAGGFDFDVADACSGLRSLLAMTALTAVYAWYSQRGLWRQWILFLSAVPLAMAGNVLRIVIIALIAVGFGQDAAIHVYEKFSGMIVFVAAVSLMVAVAGLLSRHSARREKRHAS